MQWEMECVVGIGMECGMEAGICAEMEVRGNAEGMEVPWNAFGMEERICA